MKFWLTGAIAAVLALMLFTLPGGSVTTVHAVIEDDCGNDFLDVPDTGVTFDFSDACAGHDMCYAEGGTEQDRTACDEQFLDDMLASCDDMWPDNRWKEAVCGSVAYTYFLGVRLGGWAFFPYQSAPR